ncbi:hypothetical protein [Adhaeretor mobilis]|uniref:PEP-CTERM protein-sorting domain-containing protein n=1 Tax=Adhaeretor mobilis TaxID=1930276 RepID=A0A517MVE8_9BACT|nr:hypothetical protein [Adhaeretor mobilis]QDS98846.1 hypothetical protein HG15A2_21310 [Adhaeretor mobilis]
MKTAKTLFFLITFSGLLFNFSNAAKAVDLSFAGSHNDIGGTFFPGAGPANVQSYVVVPWRSDSANNTFSASSDSGQRYYGRDGYALFGTRFDYPNANATSGASAHPEDTFFPLAFPDLVDLPDFVTYSEVLSSKVAGGYPYALIDDPALTAGYRDFNWGDTQSPPANPAHSQAPYVKQGILDGWDQFGHDPANSDPNALPAGRWGFTVGSDVPSRIRVGVMTDGLDNGGFAPKEVFLGHVSVLGNGTTYDSVSSGTLVGNRFVDMHFFDIIDAQDGDTFAFGVKANSGVFGISGVSGFSFDVMPDLDDADFDGNGSVGGEDFLIWQRGVATGTTHAEGDANLDGVVDSGDLAVWESQYGTTLLASATSVPEPTSLLLLLSTLHFWGRRFRL